MNSFSLIVWLKQVHSFDLEEMIHNEKSSGCLTLCFSQHLQDFEWAKPPLDVLQLQARITQRKSS